MKVKLNRMSWAAYRAKHPGTGLTRASSGHDPEWKTAWVDVVGGWESDDLVGHEIWHLLTRQGNEGHHPWFHFCIPALVPLRFWWHVDARVRPLAKQLRANGEVEF